MTHGPTDADHLFELAGAVCDETASQEDRSELNAMMLAQPALRGSYLDYCQVHAALRLQLHAHRATQKVRQQIIDADVPTQVEPDVVGGEAIAPTGPASPVGLWHGAAGYYSSGWPVAYLIATVVFAIGLAIAALVHVSQPGQLAGSRRSTETSPPHSPIPKPSSIVGRITGMVDCVWEGPEFRVQGSGAANQKSEIINHKSVLYLGDRLALRSGLLEITYDTGAKVILQGPVTYEVESPAGGYLSVGRLTATLEKKPEVRGQRSESANQQSEIGNRKSPDLCPLTSDLFAIRTPTALVTDLGTEFGVEVDRKGETTSHVFRGTIKVELLGGDAKRGNRVAILRENESIRTEKDEEAGDSHASLHRVGIDPGVFTRRIDRAAKALDLLDVVAGGDGFGRDRECGIDPGSGMQSTLFLAEEHSGDRQIRPICLQKLIDGVFIPDGGPKPTVLDSAGHAFDGFPQTCGKSYGLIWSRAPGIYAGQRTNAGRHWVYKVDDSLLMPNGRGLLCMHANAGITFNLDAIRKTNVDRRPVRFRTVGGMAKVDSSAQSPNATVFTANFSDGAEGWVRGDGDGPFWEAAGGQEGGYVGGIRTDSYPYLMPPIDSILCGDLANTFGSPLIRFSYYLKNIGGSPVTGCQVKMYADTDENGNCDTSWCWTPDDTSVPRRWRQYTWTVDTRDETASAGWTRTSGSGSWSESWKHVKLWNFWSGQGKGEIKNGIDSIVVSGVDPESSTPTAGSTSVAREQLADIWVFVDGRLKFKRTRFRPKEGAVPIDVEIGVNDRYLTIVVTDGGNGNWRDRVVFGDPVLDMAPIEEGRP